MCNYTKPFISTALILGLVLLSPAPSGAEDALREAPPQEPMRLTFRDGITQALEKNLDVTIERLSPGIAENRIRREEGFFDPQLFGSFKREDTKTPLSARASISAGGLTAIKSESYTLDAGVTGKIPLGTEYTLEVRDGWTADTLSRFNFQYTSFTGVRITQPLLKNFGPGPNELQVNIARKNRDISYYRLKQKVMDTIADYAFAYWDLIRARDELKVRMESGRLASALLDINRKKLEAGAASMLEVIQAEAAASLRRDDEIVARKTVRDKENSLKLLISKDVYALKDKTIIPEGEEAVGPALGPLDSSIARAISSRPDYLEQKSELDKNNIQIRYSENQRFPKVDLEASYGLNGLGSTFGGSFSGVDSNPQWSIGVVLRYPLGNNTALGDLKAARFEAGQAFLKLKKIEQLIILNVDASVKDIRENMERVEASRAATRLSEESLAAEGKKLDAGRSTTYNVLKVQEDLVKAKSNEIAAVSDYNKSLIRYHREAGDLLEELGINLRGDAPKKDAYEVGR